MDRSPGRGWGLLVLVTETMSMHRGVSGGLRMPPASACDPGLLPREFAGARHIRPRPRIPCPGGCGGELQLVWGDFLGPYVRHVKNASGRVNCTSGGEGDLHKWAKEELADYLSDKTMLHFFSRCTSCGANVTHPSVPVKRERMVKTEYQLPSGGRADIAVCVGNETKVVIEVFSTSRTAPENRPEEHWYEVDAKAVLRMLNTNQSYGELECVRPDREKCYKRKSVQKRRDALGRKTMKVGTRNGTTFEELSSDDGYCNFWLRKVVEGQYQKLNEQIRNGYWDNTIAFELPKREWIDVTSVFRDSKVEYGDLLAFVEYLVNDPDLYAIHFVGGEALRVWMRYKPGQQQVKGVTVVQYDSRSENWTNPWDAYEGCYYSKRVYDGPVDRMLENMGRRRGDIWWVL